MRDVIGFSTPTAFCVTRRVQAWATVNKDQGYNSMSSNLANRSWTTGPPSHLVKQLLENRQRGLPAMEAMQAIQVAEDELIALSHRTGEMTIVEVGLVAILLYCKSRELKRLACEKLLQRRALRRTYETEYEEEADEDGEWDSNGEEDAEDELDDVNEAEEQEHRGRARKRKYNSNARLQGKPVVRRQYRRQPTANNRQKQ